MLPRRTFLFVATAVITFVCVLTLIKSGGKEILTLFTNSASNSKEYDTDFANSYWLPNVYNTKGEVLFAKDRAATGFFSLGNFYDGVSLYGGTPKSGSSSVDEFQLVDKTGKAVLNQKFAYSNGFSEGLAATSIAESNGYSISYIDKTGSIKLTLPYRYRPSDAKAITRDNFSDKYYVFSEGMAAFRPGSANVDGNVLFCGYHDKAGKVVVEPQFFRCSKFSEGLARVGSLVEFNGRREQVFGFIDKTGQLIIPLEFQFVNDFSEGLARFNNGNTYGYIDKTGQVVIPPIYTKANDFSEGLALVKDEKTNLFGFIDKTGKYVIPPTYEHANNFSEGLAGVYVTDAKGNGSFGFIDKTGKYVIPPRATTVGEVTKGIYPINGQKGEQFNEAGFSNGVAIVRDAMGITMIDKSGSVIKVLD
jgi:hypothetical protein